ncbi:MAG: DHH family phosphoesterase [Candidatus Aenigmarchaeota archaeon]
MREKIDILVSKAARIAQTVKSTPGRVRVISHYDADGITSASIMVKALLREGRDFHLTIIKQLGEDIVQELAKEDNSIMMFLDLGSGHLDLIQKYLVKEGRLIVVADHHQVQGDAPSVLHINPVNFGVTENISGSGMSYLLARAMAEENKDLSELAIIGAIGDSQMGSIGPNWGLHGINREILKDAVSSGRIKLMKGIRLWGRYTRPLHKALEYSVDPYIPGISGSESAAVQFLQEIGIPLKDKKGEWKKLGNLTEEEQKKLATGMIKERIRDGHENPDWIFGDVYELEKRERCKDASEFATMLNATGKLKKHDLGVRLCLQSPGSEEEIKAVLESYRREIGKAMEIFRRKEKEMKKGTEQAVYIDAGDRISEHVISNVVSIITKSDLLEGKDRPVFAFVKTEDGKIKVSARASDKLVGDGINLMEVMSEASRKVGGEGGGHSGAAGATIPQDAMDGFIGSLELILKPKEAKEAPKALETNIKTNNNKETIKATENKEDYGRNSGTEEVERKGLVRYLGS